MGVFIIFSFFIGTFVFGAEQQIVALSVTPSLYVDSLQWVKHIERNKHDFPAYTVSFENKPIVAKSLQEALKKDFRFETQSIYLIALQKCIKYGPKNFENEFFETKSRSLSEKEGAFISFLCAIQCYKFINILQLEIGEYIQRHYEQRTPSPFFRELKQNVVKNTFEQEFYHNILQQAQRLFNLKQATYIVNLTKQFDAQITNLPHDSIYGIKMITVLDNYLSSLNDIMLNSMKAKL